VLGDRASRTTTLLAAAVVWAIYWTRMPSPGETFYWMTGGIENHLSIALTITILAMATRLNQSNELPQPTRFRGVAATTALCILTIVAAGTHELTGVNLVMLMAAGRVTAGRDKPRWTWTALTAAALGGFVIVYFAPGNSVRTEYFEHHGQLRL